MLSQVILESPTSLVEVSDLFFQIQEDSAAMNLCNLVMIGQFSCYITFSLTF